LKLPGLRSLQGRLAAILLLAFAAGASAALFVLSTGVVAGWSGLAAAACAAAALALAARARVAPRQLQDFADRLAGGEFTGPIAVTGGIREFDALSDALERIAAASRAREADRAGVEQALRTSEERFRVFMSNNPAACWIVDEQGRYVYLNRALAEMLDATEAALTGQSVLEVYPRELARDYDARNKRVLMEGRVVESVEKAPRRDGTLGDFATFRFPLRDSNGRHVVGGMAIDVTERTRMADALKTSEERFREFMDNNPALCWISDESGRITYVNRTYTTALKLPLDPVGRHPIELFPTAIARNHLYGVKAALEKGSPMETQEQLLRPDGSNGEFTMFRFPLVTSDVRRAVGGVAIDITERLHASRELQAANIRLQALSNRVIEVQETERRQLARELHDEIGQCLTALKINLEGLQRTASEPAVLNRVAESVELSAHTLAQVRRLSVDLRPSQLDDLGLEAALRSILDRQAATGGFAGHYEAHLDGVKLTDQVQTACFRVCQEALTNIVKHAHARNVWVTIEALGDRLTLRVRDDGRGFDPVAGSRRAAAGESFGLLGMRERASLVGGSLDIDSVPGRGSEVRAWFSINSATTDKGS
jgi:two-component system sensor histidine kinase UhpB